MRYGLIVAALVAAGPAYAEPATCADMEVEFRALADVTAANLAEHIQSGSAAENTDGLALIQQMMRLTLDMIETCTPSELDLIYAERDAITH